MNKIIRLNQTRADYQEKFEQLIESYNAGSRNIDELFQELLNLSRALNDDQQRHVRENLREEELTIFDLLTRPDPELSPEERDEVKKVAKILLDRLKTVLSLDWRKRAGSRAQVQMTIENTLDEGLPNAYSKPIFEKKCSRLFEHVYEAYAGDGQSIYNGEAA